jgi:hypothetical protein
MKTKDKNAVSLAGEFAVLSQLALRNYDANMTLGRTKGVDILVSDPHSRKMFKLEVKTKLRESDKQVSESKIFGKVIGGWLMSEKHETIADPSLFYCFVIIWKSTHKSRFFIVPSDFVARYVKEQHELWRTEKKKEGKKVKSTEMRVLRIGFENNKYALPTPTVERYEDNWDFKS